MIKSELSKAIRAALKAAGIPARSVSVTTRDSGYSTACDVRIKDENISDLQVETICKSFEKYERDERTGEILEGGNDYIFVDRDYRFSNIGGEYLEAVETAIKELAARGDGYGVNVSGTDWTLWQDGNYYRCSSAAVAEIDYFLGRFEMWKCDGSAVGIAKVLKNRELDRAYLQSKGA